MRTFDKQKQMKAIKDCLHRLGWECVKVTHLHTNKYTRTIKEYKILFKTEKDSDVVFSYTITVNMFGIDNVRSSQIVFLDIINALNKALQEAK